MLGRDTAGANFLRGALNLLALDPTVEDLQEARYRLLAEFSEDLGYLIGEHGSDPLMGTCLRRLVRAAETVQAGTAPVMPISGAELKRKRLYQSLSQRELGALIGLSPSSIWRWETDQYEPTRTQLLAAHAALG